VYLCVLCGSQNKQRLFPYTALTDWFYDRDLTLYSPVVTICTASLTFNISTLCPHSVFMCFVWISEQTAIISLYNINWLVFIPQAVCVYCAVRTQSSCIISVRATLKLGPRICREWSVRYYHYPLFNNSESCSSYLHRGRVLISRFASFPANLYRQLFNRYYTWGQSGIRHPKQQVIKSCPIWVSLPILCLYQLQFAKC